VDLWINGNGVDSYLDDDGNVCADLVREDAKLLVSERPGLSKYAPAVDPTQGLGSTTKAAQPTFADLLKD
jgi:hypothetical protein